MVLVLVLLPMMLVLLPMVLVLVLFTMPVSVSQWGFLVELQLFYGGVGNSWEFDIPVKAEYSELLLDHS